MNIGMVANVYQEINALPGLLESASQFFDDILFVHAGPGGRKSDDGTIELIEKWGARIVWSSIDDGFGVLRTQCLRESLTDWTVIMDADERITVTQEKLHCEGADEYPKVQKPNLQVTVREPSFNHKDILMRKIAAADSQGATSVRFCRRHWFDMSNRRPTQNWLRNRDYQLRCIKNVPHVYYKPEVKMHEQVFDSKLGRSPDYIADELYEGPFVDHYHCHFKKFEPEQRAEDIKVFDALHKSVHHTPIVQK